MNIKFVSKIFKSHFCALTITRDYHSCKDPKKKLRTQRDRTKGRHEKDGTILNSICFP